MSNTQLCKLEECNSENLKLLKRYEMIMRNKGCTEASIRGFCHDDIPLFLRYIKDKHLSEVTNRDIEDFIYYCQTERKNGSEAINRKYTSLNSLYKQLIRKEYLDCRNPMDKVDRAKVRRKMRDPLTFEEIEKIFKYIDEHNELRAGALYSLFYSSGCRLSEIWQLNRTSLDFQKKTFIVVGKGLKERKCIFSEDAKQRILKYLDSRDDNLEALFVSREHNRLSKSALRREMKKIAILAGVTSNVFPHKIRHTSGDHARKNKIPIEDIQVLLGHSSPAVTANIYARGNLEEVRGQFDDVFNISKTQ